MGNKNYKRGADYEREFIAEMSHDGYLGLRTAGSHSPFDVVLIPKELGNIVLCKLKRYKKAKPKIPKSLKEIKINDEYITMWFVSRKDREKTEIEIVR